MTSRTFNRRIHRPTATAAAVVGLFLVGTSRWLAAQVIPVPYPTPTSVARTPTPIPPGSIRARITLLRGRERVPGNDSVAWITDLAANSSSANHIKIAQKDKQFEPRIAVASVGSTIDFPNFDRVFHNVFSLSSPKSFDLGLYRKGKSKSVRFDQPGLVQVYCNIHPHMAAYLMVVDSRRHGTADENGQIILRSIPPGMTRIQGWNARGGMWSRDVTVRPARTTTVEVELDVTSWRETPHLNKHGKEYPPPDDDDFRY